MIETRTQGRFSGEVSKQDARGGLGFEPSEPAFPRWPGLSWLTHSETSKGMKPC